ncbi:hypothetical protein [Hoeflea sp. TYP-13]|uniref:hypothetical protein n=1 Tax=Hoeflea sp. TYP-13 TaxID=3230023 RepID=UPI0034C65E23
MVGRLLIWIVVLILSSHAAGAAETLQMYRDAEGNVHYGTFGNPNLCCMCQPALRYTANDRFTRFFLQYGIERDVSNKRVFLSGDSRAWYCEGSREMGQGGQKCGLIPPVM